MYIHNYGGFHEEGLFSMCARRLVYLTRHLAVCPTMHGVLRGGGGDKCIQPS